MSTQQEQQRAHTHKVLAALDVFFLQKAGFLETELVNHEMRDTLGCPERERSNSNFGLVTMVTDSVNLTCSTTLLYFNEP